MSYKVVLPQPLLRKPILNFEKGLKQFVFSKREHLKSDAALYTSLPTFEKEILRKKTNLICRLRRLIGVPNIRIRYDKEADLIFTYGCLLFTHKPYCIYIENGLALYNYDVGIAKNPIARMIVSFAITRKACKALIFMSKASQKSFFNSVEYNPKVKSIAAAKTKQIYPYLERAPKKIPPKEKGAPLKLFFSGMFYMKGGLELINAFEKLKKKYSEVALTIVAPLQTIKESDIERMRSLAGITLLDATLSPEEMNALYRKSDIFVLPTYRDSYGLVLQEAISWGLPLITTDQYAIPEIAMHKYNAFVYTDHPLKDYDQSNFKLFGRFYNPKDFYQRLFAAQESGKLQNVENFIYHSVEKFLLDPNLLETYSKNSLTLYEETFSPEKMAQEMESVFLEAIAK